MRTLTVPRASYFVATDDGGRVRRPRDVTLAVIGLLLILWAVMANDDVPAWAQSLTDLVDASPQWVDVLLSLGYLVSLVYAVVVIGAVALGGRERRSALRDLLIVAVGSGALVVLVSFLVNDAWPYVLPEIDLENPDPRFPVTRVALVTAILLVASPYLTRPLRRLGWLAIIATAIASVGLGYGSPVHALGSVGLGLFSAGLLLVVAGTPKGYPSPESVSDGLRMLGTQSSGIALAARQEWGVLRFEARDADGRLLEIKVHGRDSFDSQLAAKVWRTMWYREIGRTVSYSRLQAVEHEALATLMAARAGVRVPHLESVGSASADLALIAFSGGGARLDEVDRIHLSDDLLVSVWKNVATMHDARISHGGLNAGAIRLVDGQPVITDLALGSLAPDEDDRAGDVVELLFSLALMVGPERAAESAFEGLGAETLVMALPYLQVPGVSAPSRRQAESPKRLVASIKEAIVRLTGVDVPEPIKLRRVSWRSLLMAGLLLLIVFALIPALASVDYAEIWDVLQSADWALVTLALLVGQSQFFPQATATMFAVPARLPFWPLLTLQTASQFISLAIPSAAGRVAMNAAFLHKFGVSVTVALAQGAIDGFSGFIVQAAILIVVLLVGDVDLGFDIDPSEIPWLLFLGVLALVVIGVVVSVLRIRRLRERVVPIAQQAWGALQVVLKQPSRAIGLLGSNFVYWNVLGLTLWLLLGAVGEGLSYGSALFVAAGTSLFAGFMPVPGGVGVAEATMTALLATFGVDESSALAVTAVYRVITFYLPALEGFFGTRWLERNEYI